MTLTGAQFSATVTAHVVKSTELVLPAADDQIAIIDDVVVEVVADPRNIFNAASHLPELPPYMLHFEIDKAVIDIAIEGNQSRSRMNIPRIVQNGGQWFLVARENVESRATVGNLGAALDSPTAHGVRNLGLATHELSSLCERQQSPVGSARRRPFA